MYKALIQPIIDYPSIPNCIVSDTNKLQLQRIQNKYCEENLSIDQTHNRYNIDPLNVRLINKAKRSWERFKISRKKLQPSQQMKIRTSTLRTIIGGGGWLT